MNDFFKVLRMFLWMSCLTGIIYPLMITGMAHLTMKEQAAGSFLTAKGKTVGSRLIGQKFESDRYFWGRPSANDYNPLASGGSNLGPTSEDLKKNIEERKKIIIKAHGIHDPTLIPSELLYASGSGLDPHITPYAARFQVERVAKARNLEKNDLFKIIDDLTETTPFGFLGEPTINILKLNITIDTIK